MTRCRLFSSFQHSFFPNAAIWPTTPVNSYRKYHVSIGTIFDTGGAFQSAGSHGSTCLKEGEVVDALPGEIDGAAAVWKTGKQPESTERTRKKRLVTMNTRRQTHSILSLMYSTMAHFKNMLFLILTTEYRVTRNHVKINR